jgi:hypothetical protein
MSSSGSLSASIASVSVVAARAGLVSSCYHSGGEIWASWAVWARVMLVCWQRKGDRDFPQPVTLVEGIGLGEAVG